jgi:hypothetical protein|tara:strand:+ start:941 stop:1108 length:168 start_codon:yes stop_codon:yes gene_type:complete
MIEILTFIEELKNIKKLDKESVNKAIDIVIQKYEKIIESNEKAHSPRTEDPKIFN